MNKKERQRRKKDIRYKLLKNLRCRLWLTVKHKKSKSTMELTGCNIDHLICHIESKFSDGMNWNNYGRWHIDHIMPCSSFDLNNPEEQKKCFHYTNLQPLWASDNIQKSDKVPDIF